MDQLVGVAPFQPTAAPASLAAAAHVVHKIPSGDGPYARAKHYQLVEKDLDASIAWFWRAINTGDKVDSALKDMAVVMKQRGYLSEAVDAIKSLRHLCPRHSQESIDNILLDLFKASGRTREEIDLLKLKLRKIYLGEVFHGKPTKRARSHGRKILVSVKQETSRVLGNLAWAYMQERNFMAAEVVYRKAQMIDPDANKACNLALCLMHQARFDDAELVLADVLAGRYLARDQHDNGKIVRKAEELRAQIIAVQTGAGGGDGAAAGVDDGRRAGTDEEEEEEEEEDGGFDDEWVEREMAVLLDMVEGRTRSSATADQNGNDQRLPVFEEITPPCWGQMAC
ncbi:hypothetical protein ACP4OV_004665 [Aristida adscensionis]